MRRVPSSAASARAASSSNRLPSPPMLREADGAKYLLLLNADPLGGDTEGDANGEIPPSSLVGGLVLLVDSSTTDDGDVDVAREDSDGLESDDEEDHGSLGRIVVSLTPGLQRVARRLDGVDSTAGRFDLDPP